VVVPIPTLPLVATMRYDVPDEEATLSGVRPAPACILNDTEDEVALTPATVPLSRTVEVPRVVDVNHRVTYPGCPPEIPDAAAFPQ
jgi:hypothetical protein